MGKRLLHDLEFVGLLSLVVFATAASAAESNSTGVGHNDHVVSDTRQITAAILPKPFALLSVICSYVMIREVVEDQRSARHNGSPIKRVLLSMAIADVSFSIGYFLGTWPAPPDMPDSTIMNYGTVASCEFQGFIILLGYVASILGGAALSVYYLLVVRLGKSDRDLHRIERWVLPSIWIVALGWAIYPIPLDLYNFGLEVCFLESVPEICSGDECIRGSDTTFHQLALALLPILSMCLSVGIMIAIYVKVRYVENMSKKYATSIHNPSSGHHMSARSSIDSHTQHSNHAQSERHSAVNRQKSLAVARQGMFYILAFLLTYFFPLVAAVRYAIFGTWNDVFDDFAYGIFVPSAGTLNFLVFARLRSPMKTPEGRVLRSMFCCTCLRSMRNDYTPGRASGHRGTKGSSQHHGRNGTNVSALQEECKEEESPP
ncbi:expressed unknown protein [Seminavis robusta]|uniref:G-protein coupled receptors family 1 profile domain-containing protein n=1 Tax=Seminavis robusta TaxID=568900 RepID=A0A9N8DPM5_9STRA|nr:expressed unknown protein [Seminavis robusta]|eukprot:Sro249_g098570.1 n/a (431) ;mRNA; r:9114-10707